ncbi:hypothetical protein [Amaricoccus sp.]|nr:hypothetical protein [Amaricoccus sp.]MCB1371154.1 hypothetical protein [Paracoccaceae bacterium]MCB1401680.1 hypothetical protein [Paracoccaceae bacterium]HRW17104.1 hypothetical protein [Amaricoccus sp.]
MKPLALLVASAAFLAFSGAAFAACNWSEKKHEQTAETPIVLPPEVGT